MLPQQSVCTIEFLLLQLSADKGVFPAAMQALFELSGVVGPALNTHLKLLLSQVYDIRGICLFRLSRLQSGLIILYDEKLKSCSTGIGYILPAEHVDDALLLQERWLLMHDKWRANNLILPQYKRIFSMLPVAIVLIISAFQSLFSLTMSGT